MPEGQQAASTRRTRPVDPVELNITVVVDGDAFSRSLAEDLDVGEDSINRYLTQNPGKVAYWSTWHGRAKVALAAAKKRLEDAKARERERIRAEEREKLSSALEVWAALPKDARESRPKPSFPTNPEIDDRAELSEPVAQAYREMLDAEEVEGLLRSGRDAIRDLSNTLTSLSANMRAEWGSFSNKFGRAEPGQAVRQRMTAGEASRAAADGFRGANAASLDPGGEAPAAEKKAPHGGNGGPREPLPEGIPAGVGDEFDAVLAFMTRGERPPGSGDVPPKPGWHKHPRTGEWVPPETQFDENGDEIPF